MGLPEHDDTVMHALAARAGFETVNKQHGPTQLRLIGRVQRAAVGGWLLVVHRLLQSSGTKGWTADISKQYFLRDNKLVFGWRFILQGENIPQHYPAVVQLIASSPRARAVVEEQALPGASSGRNAPSLQSRGKGAQSSLNASVGPFALAQMQRGGR